VWNIPRLIVTLAEKLRQILVMFNMLIRLHFCCIVGLFCFQLLLVKPSQIYTLHVCCYVCCTIAGSFLLTMNGKLFAAVTDLLFFVSVLTFKVLETGLQPYLSQQLLHCAPTRGLRTSSSELFHFPCTNLRFGLHSFRVSAPIIWNSIPHSVRSCKSLTTFPKRL